MKADFDHCKYVDIVECMYKDTCPRHFMDEDKHADVREVWLMCINKVGCCYYED